jgi:hypothetical protein
VTSAIGGRPRVKLAFMMVSALSEIAQVSANATAAPKCRFHSRSSRSATRNGIVTMPCPVRSKTLKTVVRTPSRIVTTQR